MDPDVLTEAAYMAMRRRQELAGGNLDDNAVYEDPFVCDLYHYLRSAEPNDRWDSFRCGYCADEGQSHDLVRLGPASQPTCEVAIEVKLWLLPAYLAGKMLADWSHDLVKLRQHDGRTAYFMVWMSNLEGTFSESEEDINRKLGLGAPLRCSRALGWESPKGCETRIAVWRV